MRMLEHLVMKRMGTKMAGILSAVKPRHRMYRTAYWVQDGEDVTNYKKFRYAIVNEREKSYYQPIRNLVTNRNSFLIETNYMYDFENEDKIFTDRDFNNMWKIKNRVKIEKAVEESTLGTTKENNNTYWILSLE